MIGGADAQASEAVGMAEAERMRMKAAVYKKYGDAAILNIVLNAMPKVSSITALLVILFYLCFYLCVLQ